MLRTILNPKLILFCCACVALVTRAVWAEAVYHRRFLQDLLRGGVQETITVERITKNKAEEYLQNYGYMPKFDYKDHSWKYVDWESLREQRQEDVTSKTESRRPFKLNFNRELVEFDEALERENSQDFTLPDEKTLFEDGIKQLQTRLKVPVTGELDGATVELMSRPRCGVPDNKESEKLDQIKDEIGFHETDANTTLELDDDMINITTNGSSTLVADTNETTQVPTQNDSQVSDRLTDVTTSDLTETISTLVPTPSSDTPSRRKRYLDQFLSPRRSKRSQSETTVKYRILNYHNRMDPESLRDAIYTAFRMWDEVLPINFVESQSRTEDIRNVDVIVDFERPYLWHNCGYNYGQLDLGHAYYNRYERVHHVHFNEDKWFTGRHTYSGNYVMAYGPYDLLSVAVHEIGHAIGLEHNDDHESVMHELYQQPDDLYNVELSPQDRENAQNIFGVCSTRFDTVFDWVREDDNRIVYNTYMFKQDYYWMYENSKNRTRYGDPRAIQQWGGVPSDIDAIVHVWYGNQDDIYIFKGNKYWMYDSAADMVIDWDGRPISEGFPGIPSSNIDSAFFDKRDKHIFFFKRGYVYRFDTNPSIWRNTDRYRISDYFPNLEGPIDAAYHSYYNQKVYFFRGEDYYEGKWHPSVVAPRTNEVVNKGKINAKWKDICDVGEVEVQDIE